MKKRNRRCDPQKQAYWEDVVRRWRTSGQTVRDFCRAAGVPESALYFWRRELVRRSQSSEAVREPSAKTSPATPAGRSRKRRSESRRTAASFLPVRVVADTAMAVTGTIEIVLPQGRTIRVHGGCDRQTLVDVMAALEARPC